MNPQITEIIRQVFEDLKAPERAILIKHLTAAVEKEKPAAAARRTIHSLSASASADQKLLLLQVLASARRLGWDVPIDRPIDVTEMDKALKGSDLTARLVLKSQLFKMSLIP